MIQIDDRLCTACGVCANECPRGAIRIVDGRAQVNEETCDDCGKCVSACPQGAVLWVDVVPAMPVPAYAGMTSAPVTDRKPETAHVPLRVPTRAAAVWPLVGSALLWAGREIVPRIADLALDVLARRATGTVAGSRGALPVARLSRNAGGRHRQRQRKRGA